MADRMTSVGTLAAGVGHGINNPLSYVMANLSYALEDLPRLIEALAQPFRADTGRSELEGRAADVMAALEQALEGSGRIGGFVGDLLAFTRAGTDTMAPVELQPLLESVLNMTALEIQRRARLEKQFGPVPPVEANVSRLAHAFLNLLTNAAHAIPEGAADRHAVRLGTWTDPQGRAVVGVRDTGADIATEQLDRLFLPPFTTRSASEGAGLGLWLTHSVVTSLGGHIEVESTLGEGTAFRVVLPAAQL